MAKSLKVWTATGATTPLGRMAATSRTCRGRAASSLPARTWLNAGQPGGWSLTTASKLEGRGRSNEEALRVEAEAGGSLQERFDRVAGAHDHDGEHIPIVVPTEVANTGTD